MSLDALIEFRDAMLMHSIVHQDQGPQRLKALVSYRSDVSERKTRATAAGLLETHRCNLEVTKVTVPVRPMRKWNELQCLVRQNDSAYSFKKFVRARLMTLS